MVYTKVKKYDREIETMYLSGQSAPAIAVKLEMPLNRVYGSLKRQNIRRRAATEQNKLRFDSKPRSYKIRDTLTQKQSDLMIAGLMLYYGEGAKTGNTVDLANSDPKALMVFINFLRTICQVEESKLRFYLYCFRDQDVPKLVSFWASTLCVNKEAFTRPHIRNISSSSLSRPMKYGVLHIRYSDKKLLEEILLLIKKLTDRLI